MPFTVSVKVPATVGFPLQQPGIKKAVTMPHVPGFTQVTVNGIGVGNSCPPNVRVDENVYTVGVLGVGTLVSNSRTQNGRQKDGCRSGFPVGSRITSPPGCTASTVNETESQTAGRVVRKKIAVSQISFMIFPQSKNGNRPKVPLDP